MKFMPSAAAFIALKGVSDDSTAAQWLWVVTQAMNCNNTNLSCPCKSFRYSYFNWVLD